MNKNPETSLTYQHDEIREIFKELDQKQLSKDSPGSVELVGGMYGWICPKCGKVNAPHRDFCDCSGGLNQNIVYCNGTGNNPNPAPTVPTSEANAQICAYINTRYANKENNNCNSLSVIPYIS